jgi:predicted nucleic acid-binding protein
MKIYLDSNIPMYAAGRDHPLKAPALSVLRKVAAGEIQAASSVKVLQEILYRYSSIGAYQQGQIIFDSFRDLMGNDGLFDVTLADLLLARRLLSVPSRLDARDAVHAAICINHGIPAILSADPAFADVAGLQWVSLADWA